MHGTPNLLKPALCAVLFALAACAGNASPPIPVALSAPARATSDQDAALLRLARAARAAGDFPAAVNLYRGIQAPFTDPAIAVEWGDTLDEMESFDDAMEVYGQVRPDSPARIGALLGLVRVHLKLGQAAKALLYADEAVTLAPDDPRVLTGRGVALDAAGEHGKAQQCYRHALDAAHDDVAARNNLALSLALTANFDEAIDILTPMALSSAATPRLRQNLALIYGLKGDRARAAQISRLDLDESTTLANLALFDLAGGATR